VVPPSAAATVEAEAPAEQEKQDDEYEYEFHGWPSFAPILPLRDPRARGWKPSARQSVLVMSKQVLRVSGATSVV